MSHSSGFKAVVKHLTTLLLHPQADVRHATLKTFQIVSEQGLLEAIF